VRLFVIACVALVSLGAGAADHPNIIFILADDLGYGDVQSLNPEGKIPTPHVDRLAAEGMVFTDAHSSSSVCTPTRYGVLTGRYNWRSRMKSGVLGGFSAPLIEPYRLTVPAFLRQRGYHTACIGKWHLGMDWQTKNNKPAQTLANGWDTRYMGDDVDYSKPIQNGPNAVGFDYFFGISASLDMFPYVYITNTKSEVATVEKAFHRKGPAHVDFEAVDVLPRITEQAVEYINRRAGSGQPFFLYFPLNSPHTPIVPTDEWKGKSELNAYADFVMQTDHTVGRVLKALDDNGIADNTLIIFTSDNGCSPQAKFAELEALGHDPSHVFRGHKADIFEGGHRVPFLARWPDEVKAGSTSHQTVCLTDLMATAADILDRDLPVSAGEDSVSFLPALLGKDRGPLREATVHHSIRGAFSIRQGDWKLNLCPGSGGWSDPRPNSKGITKLPMVQLYNLASDIGEQNNLADQHPEKVAELTALLEDYAKRGRSTPGPDQPNNGDVDIYRGHKGLNTQ
jgi:arylsulfatase A-like enzyme